MTNPDTSGLQRPEDDFGPPRPPESDSPATASLPPYASPVDPPLHPPLTDTDGAAFASTSAQQNPKRTRDSDRWWFDGETSAASAGSPGSAPVGRNRVNNTKPITWVAAGLGAVAIGAASIFGIGAISSKLSENAAATTTGPGAFGQGAPNGQGMAPGASGPGAMPGMPGGMRGAGTIESIDGSTITITTPMGDSTRVLTDGSTTFTKVARGALGDIEVGDNVTVMGTSSGSTVTASRIIDAGTTADPGPGNGPGGGAPSGQAPAQAPPDQLGQGNGTTGTPGANAPGANGTSGDDTNQNRRAGGRGAGTRGVVTKIDGSTITITTTAGGTATLNTSTDTQVTVHQPSSLAELRTGDSIRAMGKTADDGTITADSVVSGAIAGPGGQVGRNGAGGADGQGFPGHGVPGQGTPDQSGTAPDGQVPGRAPSTPNSGQGSTGNNTNS